MDGVTVDVYDVVGHLTLIGLLLGSDDNDVLCWVPGSLR